VPQPMRLEKPEAAYEAEAGLSLGGGIVWASADGAGEWWKPGSKGTEEVKLCSHESEPTSV
jgi:hypothetical protein